MFISEPDHLLRTLLLSGSLGALIGLERQWDEQFRHHHAKALLGLRTFTLWALFGSLCAWFAQNVHILFFVAGFAAMVVWLTLFLDRPRRLGSDPGFTTGAAGMLTFLIGGLAFWGEERVALVLTMGIIILLALKPSVQSFARGLTMEDVRTALKFAAVTGVVLPLIPNEAFGPYGGLNPRTIGMMVVLVSGVGFTGYLAIRLLGQRNGIVVTGFLGGLVSSTATTLAMSRLSRERPVESRDCSLAVLLSCTVMTWRVGLLSLAVSGRVIAVLWPWLLLASLPGFLWCLLRLLHGGRGGVGACDLSHYGNPLRLRSALQFGLLYAVIALAAKFTLSVSGVNGILAVSGLSGFVDLNAITLSLSQMTRSGAVDPLTASRGILLAIFASNVANATISVFLGSPGLRREVSAILGFTGLCALSLYFYLAH